MPVGSASNKAEKVNCIVNDLHANGYAKFHEADVSKQISTVKNELKKIIAALCNSSKVEFDEDDPINQSLLNLAAKDRKLVGHIFDATSRLMSMHKLSLNPFSIEIAKSFMRTELVQIALDKAIRIDMPRENQYLFPLHQDYTYDPSSKDGLVFWMPLQKTNIENGGLTVYEKSHQGGIRNIKVIASDNSSVNGSKMFKMENVDLAAYKKVNIEVNEGEILVFSNLLLHHSNENLSSKVRLTIQNRFGNFLHPDTILKGWPHGNFRHKWFYETHPEFLI